MDPVVAEVGLEEGRREAYIAIVVVVIRIGNKNRIEFPIQAGGSLFKNFHPFLVVAAGMVVVVVVAASYHFQMCIFCYAILC